MLVRFPEQCRRGAMAVEFAVVAFAIFFFIFGLIVGAMGVFRFQEVANLAREGARYASVHGAKYSAAGLPGTTGVPAISTSAGLRTVLLEKSHILDSNRLTVTVSYSAPNTISPRNTVVYTDTNPNLVPPAQTTIYNYVSVTVSYQWFPELYLVGPYNFTSTSVMQMSY